MAGEINIGTIGGLLRLRDEWTDVLKRAINDVGEAGKKAKKLGQELSDVGGRLTATVTLPILAIGGAAIKMATDAVESENLFEVSFGNMSRAAREWSEEVGKALGLNRVELRRQSGVIFTMTEAMGLSREAAFNMATGISELAGDMASFFNLKPEEAFDKLRAGIVGETEPLRRLGILVDENTVKAAAYAAGIAEVGAELTQQEKVAARWLAIQQQTVKAQGDLARTLDSPANKLRRLRTQIEEAAIKLGTALMPAFQQVLDIVAALTSKLEPMVDAFAGLPPPVQKSAIALFGFAAAAGPALFVTGQLLQAWGSLVQHAPRVATAIRSLITPVNALGLAVGALLLLLNEVIRKWREAMQAEIDQMVAQTNRVGKAMNDLRTSLQAGEVKSSVLKNAADAADDLSRRIDQARESLKKKKEELSTLSADAWVRQKEEIAKLDMEISKLGRDKASLERFRELVADLPVVIDDTGDSAGDTDTTLNQLSETLKKAVDSIKDTIATNQALLGALRLSNEEFEVLNALVQAGVPLADALSGRFDDLGRRLVQSEKALEEFQKTLAKQPLVPPDMIGLPGLFQRIGEEARRALRIFAAPDVKAAFVGLPGMAAKLAETIQHVVRVFGGAGDAVKEVDAAVRSLRKEESGRLAILEEINRLLAAGKITQEEAVKVAQQLGVAVTKSASEIEAVMKRAFENIQDLAADTIADILIEWEVNWDDLGKSILRIIAQMLAKMLVVWAVNAAKRLAIEVGTAAKAAAAWSTVQSGGKGGGGGNWSWLGSLGKLFGMGGGGAAAGSYAVGADALSLDAALGGTGASSGSTSWLSGGAGGALVIGALWAAWVSYLSSQAKKAAQQKWHTAVDISADMTRIYGAAWSEQFQQAAVQAREGLRKILDAIGGEITDLPRILIQVQGSGKRFRATVGEHLIGEFTSYEEAMQAAMLAALQKANFSGVADEFVAAIKAGTIRSMEQLSEVTAIFHEIDRVRVGDTALQVRELSRNLEEMARKLAEAGISASALGDLARASWQALRDDITGVSKTAQQIFQERMEQFNRELAAERTKKAAAKAAAIAQSAAAQAEVNRLRVLLAGLQVVDEWSAKMFARWTEQLATAEALLASSAAAAAAAQAALDALPDPIKPGEFRGGGGGGGKAAREQLQDTLDAIERSLLPSLAMQFADLAVKYEQLTQQAGKNAEALARINGLRRQEMELIRQRATEELFGGIKAFSRVGPAAEVAGQLQAIQDEADRLRRQAEEWARAMAESAKESGKFFDEAGRLKKALDRIADAERRRIDMLSKSIHIDLLGGLAGLVQDEELRHRLLLEMERLRFVLEMEQLRAQFILLQEMGRLTTAQIGLLQEAFAWIDANVDKIINARLPALGGGGGGGGGGAGAGTDPFAAIRDARNRLKEILARSLSPFEQAIRGVVDEFAELRRTLGWTAEVQAAYAQEIRRVLQDQLEPIKRLQEEMAFRAGSSMRSIDQFRLAQRQLTEAQKALKAGDLSQLDKIPELAQRVLELNPAAQASEGNRFLERWVNGVLEQAQKAAESAVLGIQPGGANDPFAWLRATPTAGDNAVVNAIRAVGADLGRRQDDTTDAIDTRLRDEIVQSRGSMTEFILELKRERDRQAALENIRDSRTGARDLVRDRLLSEIRDRIGARSADGITRSGVG